MGLEQGGQLGDRADTQGGGAGPSVEMEQTSWSGLEQKSFDTPPSPVLLARR